MILTQSKPQESAPAITHETGSTPGGHHTLLILRGDQGVLQAEVWRSGGVPVGAIGIHACSPQEPGQEEETCPVLGHCYPVRIAFEAGLEAAGSYLRGDQDEAWGLLEHWYCAGLHIGREHV
jgi:hypothetical protein